MITRYTKPFSEPNRLSLADSEDFLIFGITSGKFIGQFKSSRKWQSIDISAASLRPSCNDNGDGTHSIQLKFRIPYANRDNEAVLARLKKQKLIAKYHSASNVETIAGTKEHPLTLEYSKPEGYDGYDCTLKGTQTTAESFV